MLSDIRLLSSLEKARKRLTDNYVFCKIPYGTTPEESAEFARQRTLRDQAISKYYKRFDMLRREVVQRRMAMITPLMRKITHEANLQEAERKLAEMEYMRVRFIPKVPDIIRYRFSIKKTQEFIQKQLNLFDKQLNLMDEFIAENSPKLPKKTKRS